MGVLAKGIYDKCQANIDARTYSCTSMNEIIEVLAKNGDGFVKAMWCGEEVCENTVKEKTGVGSRCIPLVQEPQENLSDVCVCCGEPAKMMIYWGKAY
jgi:prolyl-tRNA synthetase